MTTALLAANLWSWTLEITVLVAVAALAARLLSYPQARLLFWHGVFVLALLLPIFVPWKQPPPILVADGAVSITGPLSTDVPDLQHPWLNSLNALAVVIVGVALRLVWLAIGLFRLRRVRTRATPLHPSPLRFESAKLPSRQRLARPIQWRESGAITGPVTFGWLRPSILLPTRIQELPENLRRAIACHELVHVRRRDWLYVLAEELGRSLLWFHPAIWYALGQAQLAREQAVDAETVAWTGDREGYLDALLAMAERKLLPDVAPAPLFLKRRHLAARVAAILKETTMNGSRLFARVFAAVSAATAAVALAVWMFPLQSPAQALPDDAGITVDAGAKLLHRAPVHYPAGATATGTVLVEASLNAKGEVSDARVLSGPDDLRKAVLSSVLEWHYSTDVAPPPTVRITVQFNRTNSGAAAPFVPPQFPQVKGGLPPEAAQWTGTISEIRFAGLSSELQQQVESRLPVHTGDAYTHDTFPSTVAALNSVDHHLNLTVWINRDGGPVILLIALADSTNPKPLRVGGNVQAQNLITKIAPTYPPAAKQARLQGKVSLAVLIAKDGTVANVQVIDGDPLLTPSAMEAVWKWVYKPTLLNGQPVEVQTVVDVNYTLAR
jgi:TonB family protein